jgi:5-oxoprolinase (ATP-hydrolysing) subunit A
MRVDLNCDLGESYGVWTLGHDDEIMPSLSSASVACGFHAGDAGVIRRTLKLAKAHRVSVGAHPSFPDLAGFGRRPMALEPEAIEDLVLYQVSALAGMAAAEGLRLAHVKPHGALYNVAARDRTVADAIARAVALFDAGLVLFGPPDSCLIAAGVAAGLPVAREVFADRAYEPDGRLRSRSLPGALIVDLTSIGDRVIQMVEEHTVTAVDGTCLPVHVDTICVHGDTPGVPALARCIRTTLEKRGILIAPPSPPQL